MQARTLLVTRNCTCEDVKLCEPVRITRDKEVSKVLKMCLQYLCLTFLSAILWNGHSSALMVSGCGGMRLT
eukprot:1153097-Pelagomonas_calceolata.AAC.1